MFTVRKVPNNNFTKLPNIIFFISLCIYVITMGYRKITREELENLYSHEAITRSEYRYLMRVAPNRISQILTQEFHLALNALRVPDNKTVQLRGFLHSAPKSVLAQFNRIHYQLKEELGDYKLAIISASPTDLTNAIPLIIPTNLITTKDYDRAHFAKLTSKVYNLATISSHETVSKTSSARFLVTQELSMLGFEELFNLTRPILTLKDINQMLESRFNLHETVQSGILFWLFSSPVYEGRMGGNALSPVIPKNLKHRCDDKILTTMAKDLIELPLPYFSNSKPYKKPKKFEYDGTHDLKLRFIKSQDLYYEYEDDLATATDYLTKREMSNPLANSSNIEDTSELNLTTGGLSLDPIFKRPLASLVQNPIMPAKLLTRTDLPLLISKNDIVFDEKEDELLEYGPDINHFVYYNYLKNPRVQLDFIAQAGAVKNVMDKLEKDWYELHELMKYGIVFDTAPIGGLGEHLVRISHSILRSTKHPNIDDSLNTAEELFNSNINRFFDEFRAPINRLYYDLEEQRSESEHLKKHKLRNLLNSILYELNNVFPEGWSLDEFEVRLKKRSDYTLSKIQELFNDLLKNRWITEKSPGLYWQIVGFDRFL